MMTFSIDLFNIVNRDFTRRIKRYVSIDFNEINLLGDFDINTHYFILEIYNIIKLNYISLFYFEDDIYSIIIFLYYALVLFEPHDNLLYFADLEYLSLNVCDTKKFCMKVAISNEEFCSEIRRNYFSFNQII